MESYAAPARTLTPTQADAMRYFYGMRWSGGRIVAVAMPPVYIAVPLGLWQGAWVGIAGALAVAGLIAGLFYWSAARKLRRATFIYEHGQPETVTFAGLGANYGFKVNGQPQPVIELLRGGEPLQIKTFDRRIIQAFSLPRQTVYTHPAYPDVLVPSGLFALDRTAGPRVQPRSVGV